MLKHYIEFIYPGAFFSETSEQETPTRDHEKVSLQKGSYGFRFYDRVEQEADGENLVGPKKNYSGWFFEGELFDLERVKNEVPDSRILQSNMKSNNWQYVVKTKFGTFVQLEKEDQLIKPKEADQLRTGLE